MFLRALPPRLGKNFFDKAILRQFIDHTIVDDFGSERFGVDAFDGFELQDRGHISAIDTGCFFSELGDESVSFLEKIGIIPFEIFCQHSECGLSVVIHRADGFDVGFNHAFRGVGIVLGPFLVRPFIREDDLRTVFWAIAACFAVFAASYAFVPLMPTIYLAGLFVLIGHLGGGGQWTLSSFALHMIVPDHIRGPGSSGSTRPSSR